MKKFPVVILLLITLPLVMAQNIEKVAVSVYPDGYVKVTEVIVPPNYSVVVNVPLLSSNVTGLSVFDQNGKPLLFEKNGSALTVYLLNSTTQFNVTYFTASLTTKTGEIWNLSYNFPYPVTVKLPPGAIVVALSAVPLTITSDSITMPPGNQSVSYILPPPTTTPEKTSTSSTSQLPSPSQTKTTPSTQTNSTTAPTLTSTPQTPSKTPVTISNTSQPASGKNYAPLFGVLAVVGISVGAFLFKKRSKSQKTNLPVSREELLAKLENLGLTDDEINALLYVYDHGGKARQADVRRALGIPKTTAWRMFKRLEEKGLVRVYKRGKENWVELIFT
ncbi:MarR family transcriptional regulator [Thermococcus sp.]|uniref:helix-turn-helix transcriptional regulator n=1 Tax=Thermococcus sp. TaxID=35749 RepID=UPI00262953B2|nr:MarR family transcriptional regulator [Thermococcus sp.]